MTFEFLIVKHKPILKGLVTVSHMETILLGQLDSVIEILVSVVIFIERNPVLVEVLANPLHVGFYAYGFPYQGCCTHTLSQCLDSSRSQPESIEVVRLSVDTLCYYQKSLLDISCSATTLPER